MGGRGTQRAELRRPLGPETASRIALERRAIDGNSPVGEVGGDAESVPALAEAAIPSRAGHVKSRLNSGGPPSKAKYSQQPIANQYREGKVKSTPGGE
jgi:hypothetical protein